METPKCQQALLCGKNCHADECQKVDFEIKDASGQSVSIAKRRGKGFLENMLSDADRFDVHFTDQMPWNHRVLLVATMIFIDFRMFETSASSENQSTSRRRRHY